MDLLIIFCVFGIEADDSGQWAIIFYIMCLCNKLILWKHNSLIAVQKKPKKINIKLLLCVHDVYKLAANTISRFIEAEASSIFRPSTGFPIILAASFTSRRSSSNLCIHLTIIPSCTSVNCMISLKGCKKIQSTLWKR